MKGLVKFGFNDGDLEVRELAAPEVTPNRALHLTGLG